MVNICGYDIYDMYIWQIYDMVYIYGKYMVNIYELYEITW
jgi:hypothetical protein